MLLEKRMPDLLALLESYVGGATLEVPIVPRPPTPALPPPFQTKTFDKKWKRDKNGGKVSSEEGEIHEETPPEQSKATKVSWTWQMKGGKTSNMISKHRPCAPNWNPPLMLDMSPPSYGFFNP